MGSRAGARGLGVCRRRRRLLRQSHHPGLECPRREDGGVVLTRLDGQVVKPPAIARSRGRGFSQSAPGGMPMCLSKSRNGASKPCCSSQAFIRSAEAVSRLEWERTTRAMPGNHVRQGRVSSWNRKKTTASILENTILPMPGAG
jgi:hypothetical protein